MQYEMIDTFSYLNIFAIFFFALEIRSYGFIDRYKSDITGQNVVLTTHYNYMRYDPMLIDLIKLRAGSNISS